MAASAMSRSQKLSQEIIDNMARLSSNSSEIGDYRVMKCLEYQAMGRPMPYDLEEICAERQKCRDRINECQSELDTLAASEQGEDGAM